MRAIITLAAIIAAADMNDGIDSRDAYRFCPSAELAFRNWFNANAHCNCLQDQPNVDFNWLTEARYCRNCWDMIDDCLRVHPEDHARCLLKLRRLRELIGHEDYRRGLMPPAVPYWRFQDE